jgi:hypothetical protein
MPREASLSPGAIALRRAGYLKCPAWWLTKEQFELLQYMAQQNLPEINRIKEEAYDLPDYASYSSPYRDCA